MTDQELKKLSRQDLLELLLIQSKEMEELKEKLKQAEEELSDRRIKLQQSGSIAEAALQLNGVFAAAEKAAAQWLENIQHVSSYQDETCVRKKEDKTNEEENQADGDVSHD